MSVPGYPDQQPPHQGGLPPSPGYALDQQPPAPPAYPAPPGQPAMAQPFPGAPMPPPKKKWLLPTLIGGAVTLVLCCGGSMVIALSSDADTTTGATTASAPPPATDAKPSSAAPATAKPKPTEDGPKTYKVGQPVRGGDFQFTVHGVKCGIGSVGDSFLNTKAQGTFCRADISVKNMTKKAQLFHADGTITAQDGGGREYSADGEAGIYGNKSGAGFLEEINPGNSIRAFVFFDVPKGTKLTSITLDSGLFTLAEDAVVTL
ncbi:DUF4352 domain-containing protein [Micromonospora inyonensis]|uniref:DUF4352 domain-containing protein n=1 Tax=Micromonospora inyonensis TaxID=47866 RepID=A0A1C6RPX9_9ACTN|nr:DUF4352 domain-containing protein [Micromonospora inyonensis]SCL19232.1 protein of unknown function [Micromonospora inyonensis]